MINMPLCQCLLVMLIELMRRLLLLLVVLVLLRLLLLLLFQLVEMILLLLMLILLRLLLLVRVQQRVHERRPVLRARSQARVHAHALECVLRVRHTPAPRERPRDLRAAVHEAVAKLVELLVRTEVAAAAAVCATGIESSSTRGD